MALFEQMCAERDIIPLGLMKAGKDPHYQRFKQWIKAGKHGTMTYLERYSHIRENPSYLEPEMDQVWVCGFAYGQKQGFTKKPRVSSSPPLVAQYARYKDYHGFLRSLGQDLMERYLEKTSQLQARYRVVVDSAPIMEKSLAVQTGRGFMGKNTLFILPDRGSFLFLFEIFTSASFPDSACSQSSKPLPSCGSCRRCMVHCPTGALDEEYVLDATKCLAYYTIEHRGVIPVAYWAYLGEYYFGCDICQLVCPYNRHAHASKKLKRWVPEDLMLKDIAMMGQKNYERWFGGTPMTRSKKDGLRRNAVIALYVTSHHDFKEVEKFVITEQNPLLVATLKQIPEYEAFQQRGGIS